jgi:hypothetical protein
VGHGLVQGGHSGRWFAATGPGYRGLVAGDGQHPDPARRDGEFGPEPPRRDRRLYFALMTVCVGLFVAAWAVVRLYSVLAAAIMTGVALVIPPFAAIIANRASATDRRGP